MGLALEFKQPLLLAEGLAQSAVYYDWWYIEFLTKAEKMTRKAEERFASGNTYGHDACRSQT